MTDDTARPSGLLREALTDARYETLAVLVDESKDGTPEAALAERVDAILRAALAAAPGPDRCGWDTRRGDGPIGGPCALPAGHDGPHDAADKPRSRPVTDDTTLARPSGLLREAIERLPNHPGYDEAFVRKQDVLALLATLARPSGPLREAAQEFIDRNARRMDPDMEPVMADTDEVILYGTAGEFRALRALAADRPGLVSDHHADSPHWHDPDGVTLHYAADEPGQDDLVLVRKDSGGVFRDGTTNHPAIDFEAAGVLRAALAADEPLEPTMTDDARASTPAGLRGTICKCGAAKSYHGPPTNLITDHEYEPRYPENPAKAERRSLGGVAGNKPPPPPPPDKG